ncbi:VOC family protein [Pseudomonas sp. CGJS7]|uniref:VOC family protein n=1 Tax=Pseudomonas sp. CGJS7 TaxID=3109348 RepID=UPI00300AA48C
MLTIDHLILRVSDAQASIGFYRRYLDLSYEGRAEPFEVLRVNADSTLDLLNVAPKDPLHLAFRVDRERFEATRERLRTAGIAFGGGPFARDGRSQPQLGAGGWAEALYFFDPDRHNIEIRTHEPR